jgi:hypothetical protein
MRRYEPILVANFKIRSNEGISQKKRKKYDQIEIKVGKIGLYSYWTKWLNGQMSPFELKKVRWSLPKAWTTCFGLFFESVLSSRGKNIGISLRCGSGRLCRCRMIKSILKLDNKNISTLTSILFSIEKVFNGTLVTQKQKPRVSIIPQL